jgi:alkaline phosphatase D
VLCDVDRDRFRGDLKVLDSVTRRDGALSTFARFISERGKAGLQRA